MERNWKNSWHNRSCNVRRGKNAGTRDFAEETQSGKTTCFSEVHWEGYDVLQTHAEAVGLKAENAENDRTECVLPKALPKEKQTATVVQLESWKNGYEAYCAKQAESFSKALNDDNGSKEADRSVAIRREKATIPTAIEKKLSREEPDVYNLVQRILALFAVLPRIAVLLLFVFTSFLQMQPQGTKNLYNYDAENSLAVYDSFPPSYGDEEEIALITLSEWLTLDIAKYVRKDYTVINVTKTEVPAKCIDMLMRQSTITIPFYRQQTYWYKQKAHAQLYVRVAQKRAYKKRKQRGFKV